MSSKRSAAKAEIAKSLENCILISVDGVSYFGEVKKEEGLTSVTKAVECSSTLQETVRNWIKSSNMGQLQQLNVSGMATFVERPLTDDQKDEIELVVLKAAIASVNALPELINSKF
jgi:hypothetical protein